MKHIVTGACGFVGSAIVRDLVNKGHKVIAIDVIEDAKINSISEFHKVDILDKEKLSQLFRGVDCVHHNAALVPLSKSGKKFYKTNVIGTKNIIELSLQNNNVSHISHMSSSAIFGKPKNYKSNVDYLNYNPTGVYGISKYKAEMEMINNKEKFNSSNISCSIIRPRPILGKGRLGIFEILFDWVKDDKKIPIIGDGNNLFQFADISDLVDVSVETSESNISGIFNIGTDRFNTLKNDLNNFFNEVKSNSKVLPINKKICVISLAILDKLNLSPLSSWHYLSYGWNFHYDLKETFKVLKWRPKYSNVEMLCNSYYDYLKRRNELDYKSSLHRSKIKQKFLRIIKKIL